MNTTDKIMALAAAYADAYADGDDTTPKRKALRAEIETLVRDAERYRRLRDGENWPAVFASSQAPEPLRGSELDAAMQEKQS